MHLCRWRPVEITDLHFDAGDEKRFARVAIDNCVDRSDGMRNHRRLTANECVDAICLHRASCVKRPIGNTTPAIFAMCSACAFVMRAIEPRSMTARRITSLL